MNPAIPHLLPRGPRQTRLELPDASVLERAYLRFAADRAALPDAELRRPNLDALSAAHTVLSAWPRLRPLRAQWLAKLPESDVRCLDELCDRAYAMVHAFMQTSHLPRRAPDDLAAMYEEARLFRAKLVELGRVLVAFRILPAETFAGLGAAVGHRNLAMELAMLAQLYRAHWARIEGRAPIEFAQVEACERLAHLLMVASIERGAAAASLARAQALRERQRAFTHFVQAFDEVRRALQYLRWREGDADALLPTIYGGRTTRRARRPSAPAGEPPPEHAAGSYRPHEPDDPRAPLRIPSLE